MLMELRTFLIGMGFSDAMVQSSLGVLILLLVAAYGRDRHIRNLI
jgi:ribose transport system permease protein